MPGSDFLRDVARYYESRLREFGPIAHGVDWNSAASQRLRFDQLIEVIDGVAVGRPIEILDVGCGYGALVAYLEERRLEFRYTGYDISAEMLEAAERLFGGRGEQVRFLQDWDAVPPADFAVASGVFHVRLACDGKSWGAHILDSLRAIHAKTRRAWAANFLTSYSDDDRKEDRLYYADPRFLFDWCKRHLAKEVALLHDYGLYEFTLIVRKAARACPP